MQTLLFTVVVYALLQAFVAQPYRVVQGSVWVNGTPLDESGYVYGGEPTYAFDQRLTSWDVPEGALFVLGDHRTNSTDSRTARIGLIPVDDVLGRAFLRYWPIGTLTVLDAPDSPPLTVGAGDESAEAP